MILLYFNECCQFTDYHINYSKLFIVIVYQGIFNQISLFNKKVQNYTIARSPTQNISIDLINSCMHFPMNNNTVE